MLSTMVVGRVSAAGGFDPAHATYRFLGDTFTLSGGKAQIMGHSGLPGATGGTVPIGYTLARTASGQLEADGGQGEVVALYRSFGANLQWVVLFGFRQGSGGFTQIASGPVYGEAAQVQSLSVAHGIVTVNLLVVSEADRALPHYAQKPTQPLALRFGIAGDRFVEKPSG